MDSPHHEPPGAPRSGQRTLALSGAAFAVFSVAGFALLGDLLGSFADADRAFIEHAEGTTERAGDI